MRETLLRTLPIAIDWRLRESAGAILLVGGAILLFSVLPLARLAAEALEPGIANFLSALSARDVRVASLNTLVVAAGSSAIAIACGTAFAVTLACTDVRGRHALAFLFVLSLMVAPQVAALAFKTLAGPASPLLKTLGIAPAPGTPNPMLGAGGIIFVMGLQHAPLAAIAIAAGLTGVPRSLVEAAQVDGVPPFAIVRRIVLPVIRPHLLSAGLLVLVAGIGNFGIPALLGLPVGYNTLPTLVYRKLASFGPQAIGDAAAVSLLIAVIAAAGVASAVLLVARQQARLEEGPKLSAFWPLGRWRLLVEALLWAFIGVAVLAPAASLLATSLVPAYGLRLGPATATLSNFAEVLWRQQQTATAFANSLAYAGSAALLLGILSLIAAHVIDRRSGGFGRLAMAAIDMPYAVPGIVLAIACILLFLPPLPILGVSIYGTAWIIVFAYLARFFAVALKPVLAAMQTMDAEIEEAAICDGARFWTRLRLVVLPVLFPAVVAGMLMAFLLAFNELTVSALLWSAGTQTLGVALLSLEDAGLAPQASAVAVSATLVIAAVMLGLDGLRDRLPESALPWRQLAGRR